MKKQNLLKIVNLLLMFIFLISVLSIVIYRWGPNVWRGTELGYNIHVKSAPLFAIIAVIHVILNFRWIKTSYFKKKEGGTS